MKNILHQIFINIPLVPLVTVSQPAVGSVYEMHGTPSYLFAMILFAEFSAFSNFIWFLVIVSVFFPSIIHDIFGNYLSLVGEYDN